MSLALSSSGKQHFLCVFLCVRVCLYASSSVCVSPVTSLTTWIYFLRTQTALKVGQGWGCFTASLFVFLSLSVFTVSLHTRANININANTWMSTSLNTRASRGRAVRSDVRSLFSEQNVMNCVRRNHWIKHWLFDREAWKHPGCWPQQFSAQKLNKMINLCVIARRNPFHKGLWPWRLDVRSSQERHLSQSKARKTAACD